MTPQGHPGWNLMVLIEGHGYLPISAHGVQPRMCHRFPHILNQSILTLIFDPSGSSKVKFDGANWKPIGTFLYDLCGVQHRISYRLATNHPHDQPTTQPTNQRHDYMYCRHNYCSLDLKNKAWPHHTGSRWIRPMTELLAAVPASMMTHYYHHHHHAVIFDTAHIITSYTNTRYGANQTELIGASHE